MQKYLLFQDEPHEPSLCPHLMHTSSHTALESFACICCPRGPGLERGSALGICVDPFFETLTQSKRSSLWLRQQASYRISPHSCVTVNISSAVSLPTLTVPQMQSVRCHPLQPLAHPSLPPLSPPPGIGTHHLTPDLALISVASMLLCVLPLA